MVKLRGSVRQVMACDHRNSEKIYVYGKSTLYRCGDCRLVFTPKRPDDPDPKAAYENYYHNEMALRFGYGLEYVVRLFRFFRAFKIFTINPGAKTILDVGSGRGFMLLYLKKYYGYKRTAGTQISKKAFEFSKYRLGLEIYDRDLLELPFDDGSFDVITMWHVLEHVNRPEEYIEKIYRLLRKGGRLVIEVPNFNSWSRAVTGKYWLGLDLDYHVNFFTPETLVSILKKRGFKTRLTRTFSLEYSIFLSAESLASFAARADHVFYKGLQDGTRNTKFFFHLILFIMLTPICALVNLCLWSSRRGEILLVAAQK